MKITIECTPKEIADHALVLQERQICKNILEKQMELLSKASEVCEENRSLIQNIPALTHAMVEISKHFCANEEDK